MKIVFATILAMWATGTLAQGKSIEIKAPNDMATVLRPSSVGTNVPKARVIRTALPDGALAAMVVAGLQGPMADCEAPRGLKIQVEESSMRDSIGDSSSQLEGIGIYASLPDMSATVGNWYVAPFVALRLVAFDLMSTKLGVVEVTSYEKRTIPAEVKANAYLELNAHEIDQMLRELVTREVANAARKLLSPTLCRG